MSGLALGGETASLLYRNLVHHCRGVFLWQFTAFPFRVTGTRLSTVKMDVSIPFKELQTADTLTLATSPMHGKVAPTLLSLLLNTIAYSAWR